jgi:hypothetical protein
MNNQNEITKGKELIIYSETSPNQDDSFISKINKKFKEFLNSCENYRQQLINHHYYQKTIILVEKYGSWVITIIISLIVIWLLFFPRQLTFLTGLLSKLKFLFLTLLWACLGMLVGAIILSIMEKRKQKIQTIVDNTKEFIDYCLQSNGMVFFGPVGTGKTATLAMIAYHSPIENKYASFPCSLPWMKRYQISFDMAPDKPLGIREDILIDEINLLFKGNVVDDVRKNQNYVMHFIAVSRQHGVRIFANGQRLGQFSIEQREVTTAVCQTQLIQKTDEGIWVKCEIWQSAAWTQQKTEASFNVFIAKKYLDTYNSYWLKSLKYLRKGQSYI